MGRGNQGEGHFLENCPRGRVTFYKPILGGGSLFPEADFRVISLIVHVHDIDTGELEKIKDNIAPDCTILTPK